MAANSIRYLSARLAGSGRPRRFSSGVKSLEFDYVVVGAGSAGSCIAFRLAEAGNSVAVLEAGPHDIWHPASIFLHMPTALSIPMNMDSKVLGGSSSINGMAFVRGHARDFDTWEELGAKGWNYASCLPYFKRSETFANGPNQYRGGSGPVQTRFGAMKNPLYDAFIQAGQQAGYPYTSDYNAFQQEGFGPMAMSVDQNGRRSSTANAYLRKKPKTLSIFTNQLIRKIAFAGEGGGGG
ncbi:hypothetical protein AAMO2058_000390600 [Amorphochlora amoebiformis]